MLVIRHLRACRLVAAAAACAAAAAFAAPAPVEADDPPSIVPEEAAAYAGRMVRVEGTLRSARTIRSMSGRHCVLGFGPSVDRGLTVAVYPRVYDRFPRRPEVYFRNRRVTVRGKVTLKDGEPRIVLLSPGRLKRVGTEDDEATVPGDAEPETGP